MNRIITEIAESIQAQKISKSGSIRPQLTGFIRGLIEQDEPTSMKDQTDHITMDVPLFIRILELVREDVRDDAELHEVASKIIAIRNRGILTMADYEDILPNRTQDDELDECRRLAGLRKGT